MATAQIARNLPVKFFPPNAERLYVDLFQGVCFVNTDFGRAKWIAGHVLAHGITELRARDIKRAYRDLNNDDATLGRAMEILTKGHWCGEAIDARSNSIVWKINPRVHEKFPEQAAFEKERREKEIEKINKAGKTIKNIIT